MQAMASMGVVPASTNKLHGLDPRVVAFTHALFRDLQALRAIVNAQGAAAQRDRGSIEDTAARLYPAFGAWLDERLEELGPLFDGMSKERQEFHAAFFRARMHPLTEESAFLKRTNDRPRGYAGDSELMRMIYDQDFRGDSVFGALLHHHPLQTDAAKAVRHRVGLVADMIRRQRELSAGTSRVLSLACGPARELRNVISSVDDTHGLEMVLADQDEDALLEACAEIATVESILGAGVSARTEKLSVRDVLRGGGAHLGNFDMIYTLGLFDYLPDLVAQRLVARLVAMLAPGGSLVVGNFHVSCTTRAYLDVWMEWPLLYRTEEEMLALASGLDVATKRVEHDPTGSQMFLTVTARHADDSA